MKTNWERHNPIIRLPSEAITAIIKSYDVKSTIQRTTLLSGGLSHTNYKVDFVDREPVVIRVTKNLESLQRERNLHMVLPGEVRAPRFLHFTKWNGYGVGILEWKEGCLLRDTFVNASQSEMLKIGKSIGEQLATMRQLTFDTYGFLDHHLAVKQEFHLTPDSFLTTMESFLSSHAAKWLSSQLIEGILSYSYENAHLFNEDKSSPRLVHGDFNGLNLLMNGTDVSAVLDWEFALSGSIYFDIGNMLRYEFPHLASFEHGLQLALTHRGILLTENWKRLAKLADLIALCSLLDRPICGVNRVKDITNLIKMTIDHN
ncbi:MAG: aminoglycoside phosphotransferase family protein [Anaerobacillus sp.]